MTLSALCYAAGYTAGAAAFLLMAKCRRLLTDGIMLCLAAGLIGGLVCANLAQVIIGGSPGKTVLGGIAGGYLCVMLAKRLQGIRRPLGDLFAVAISTGEAVGRWGCFFGGCCYGKPCNMPWAVWQHNAWRHPTQIYLSIANVFILLALWRFARTKPPENGLFNVQGVLYCAARFGVEFLRDTPPAVAGLTAAQWACLAGGMYFAVRFAVMSGVVRNTPPPLTPPSRGGEPDLGAP